jgi:hypothetical protein
MVENFLDESSLEKLPQLHSDCPAPLFVEAPQPPLHASVHQHLGEPRVADDQVDDQRVLARVGDAVWVILAAEGDDVLRPIEEGGAFSVARTSCRSRLRWLLDMFTVNPPKMRKTFSNAGKSSAPLSPPSFLASPSFEAARL